MSAVTPCAMCYHTTTRARVSAILRDGIRPGSAPQWFSEPVPYIMLAPQPWGDLNGEESVVLRVNGDRCEPQILAEYLDDPDVRDHDGLRWPYVIPADAIEVLPGGVSR